MPYTKTQAVKKSRRERAEIVQQRSRDARKGKSLEQLRDEQFKEHGESKEYLKLCTKIDAQQAAKLNDVLPDDKKHTSKLTQEQKEAKKKATKEAKKALQVSAPKGFTLRELCFGIVLLGIIAMTVVGFFNS